MLKEMENLEKTSANTIIFRSPKHKKFYIDHMTKCRYQDVYHKALVYCLGIDRDTREHVNDIYDFKTGLVNPECLQEGWQTSGSTKIVRMAFNLKRISVLQRRKSILQQLCPIFLGSNQNTVSRILFKLRMIFGGIGIRLR